VLEKVVGGAIQQFTGDVEMPSKATAAVASKAMQAKV
jgi:uncharacterized alkaline shock family protein YloU